MSGPLDIAARAGPNEAGASNQDAAVAGSSTAPVLSQPSNSPIEVLELGDTLTVRIPATGLVGMARGMALFAALWLAFTAVISAGALFGQIKPGHEADRTFGLLFMVPFWAAGVAMSLAAWQGARRRAVILVSGESVVFTQAGPLRKVERQWPRASLEQVRVGPSHMRVNDQPVPQLQFLFADDTGTYGLLTARDPAELAWLAARLRGFLGLSEPVAATIRPGQVLALPARVRQPPGSRARIAEAPGVWSLEVPPQGLRGPTRLILLLGTLLLLVPLGIAAVLFWSGEHRTAPWPEIVLIGGLVLVFMAAGAAVTLGGLWMARQRCLFTVAAGRLTCRQVGLVRVRETSWALEEVADIRVQASSTSVNDQPLLQLALVPRDGSPLTMLTGRAAGELAWLAGELRQHLSSR